MENPIKYSDLITPDDSIEKLIEQLTNLNEAYSGMADSVKSQASQVAASLRSVSGATEQGRNATRNASQEADRLAKAYKDLEFVQSNTAKRIQELKQLKNEEARMTKLQIQLNRSAEGSYNQLSAQYSLNKMAINNLTKAERENDPAAKKLIEDTKEIYEQMKRMQEATGKFSLNVGNYENAITNAIGVNTRWYQNIQQLGQLFEGGFSQSLKTAGVAVGNLGKQFLALLANPIVATIAAVTAAFMALAKGISSSEENTNKLSQVLAPFERILTGVVNVLQKMAGFILDVVAGMEQMVMWCSKQLESLPLVGKAIQSVNRALEENIELKKQQAWLDKAERTKNEANAKLARDVARLKNLAAQTNDTAEKQRILNLAKQGEMKIMKNELALAQRDLAIKEAKAKQAGNDKKTNDELAAARVRLYRAEEQYYTGTMRLERQLNTLRNKESSGGGGKTGKANTSAVDEAKKMLDEQRKIEDARIALEEDSYERERKTIISNYNRKIEDAKTQYGEETELAVLFEQEKQKKLADLFDKQVTDAQKYEEKKEEERINAIQEGERKREQAVREGEQRINQQYELDMSYVDLQKNENKKTDMRLQAEKKRLQALLALYQKDGKTLTDVEVQTIQNAIEAVDQEIDKNKKKRDLWDLLGFDLDDEHKKANEEAFKIAMGYLNDLMDAYQKAADQRKKLADEAVDSTKSVLEAEIEARNAGYANEVETARKEYENAKKNQEKALQEQRKAQQAKETIDAAKQVSSLITATANIWAGFTEMGPWGIAAAIAATALMWGSFAAAKIKAHEVAGSSTESYGEGTVQLLEGGSHQSGNDIDLGRKADGTRRRAEGGEFFAVINKRNSRKFRDVIPSVIHSLNDGTFADKYMNAYDGGGMAILPASGTNLTRVEEGIDRINGNLEKPHTYTDGRGNTVLIYKNLKRTTKYGN